MNDTLNPTPPPAVPQPPLAAPPPYPVTPIPAYYIEKKSPFLAALLSFFIPGLGHLYVGAYQRALQVFGGLFAAILLASMVRGPAWVFIVFAWFFGIVDSVRLAQAVNRGTAAESSTALEERMKSNGTAGLTLGVILIGLGLLWWIDKSFDIDWTFMHRWGGPVAFVLLGVVLVASHINKKRKDHENGVGLPPRSR